MTAADAVWLLCAAAITAAWWTFHCATNPRPRQHRRTATDPNTTTGGTR